MSLLTNNDLTQKWSDSTAGRQSVTFYHAKNQLDSLLHLEIRGAFAIDQSPGRIYLDENLIVFNPPLKMPYKFRLKYNEVALEFDDQLVKDIASGVKEKEKGSALYTEHFFSLGTNYSLTVSAGFPSAQGKTAIF